MTFRAATTAFLLMFLCSFATAQDEVSPGVYVDKDSDGQIDGDGDPEVTRVVDQTGTPVNPAPDITVEEDWEIENNLGVSIEVRLICADNPMGAPLATATIPKNSVQEVDIGSGEGEVNMEEGKKYLLQAREPAEPGDPPNVWATVACVTFDI